MRILSTEPSLQDIQTYVAEMEQERGFADQGVIEKCLLLGEEVGELFKAVRTQEGLKVDVPGGEIGAELADILIYLCAIANRFEINIEEAFRAKEAQNQTRRWQ
ncbi:MAG: pyrophosphohydrolase [bacterium]|nr:pyrophosphohydrolase [bacterium]